METNVIPNWDDYFFEFAKTAAFRSNCMRAKVGAVIVDEDKRIISTGYNGVPSGVKSCIERGYCIRQKLNIPSGTQYDKCHSIHAEQNAIIQSGRRLCKGSSIYIYGHSFVCILCKRFIINSGIEKILVKKDDSSPVLYQYTKDYIVEVSEYLDI